MWARLKNRTRDILGYLMVFGSLKDVHDQSAEFSLST